MNAPSEKKKEEISRILTYKEIDLFKHNAISDVFVKENEERLLRKLNTHWTHEIQLIN